jgi:carbonic anhydrase
MHFLFVFQLELFRALLDEEGNPLTHNFRPVQPLGDRIVLYNTDEIIKDVGLDEVVLENEIPGNELENMKHRKHRKGKNQAAAMMKISLLTVLLMPIMGLFVF